MDTTIGNWKDIEFQKLFVSKPSHGLTKPSAIRGDGFKMVNMGELYQYDRLTNQEMELVPLNDIEKNNFSLDEGDLLFARQSLVLEGVGKCSIVVSVPELTVFESHLIRIRLNKKISNPEFYHYFFSSYYGKKLIQTLAIQVAASGIRSSELAKLKVPYPSKSIQDNIAVIFASIDSLIEKNSRRVEILEAMAQLLYREWFVEFRFPGYEKHMFVDSELGKIPEGWRAGTLRDVLKTLESGSRPSGGIDEKETEIVSVGAENIIGLGQYNYGADKFVSTEFFNAMRKGHIKSRDVLLYKDGAQIGRKSMFRDNFPHKQCCVNEHVFILRSNDLISQNYLYFWLDLPNVTEMIVNSNSNAAQPGINQQDVNRLPILVPAKPVVEAFEEVVEPMMKLLFNLAKINIALTKTRDLLLPKLMSGEIDVSKLDINITEN